MCATIVFVIISCVLMICFKCFEDYFDSHGRLALAAEAALAKQDSMLKEDVKKKNFPVTIVDEPKSQLQVPFSTQVTKELISITEEFAQNKIVITLKEGTSYMKEGIALTCDSMWTEAIGVYKSDTNVVVEVYCNEACGYEVLYEKTGITLSFLPIEEQYSTILVLYTPWENREKLLQNEWQQTIQKLENTYSLKIYSALAMQEEYQPTDVIRFANEVRADAVIGMEFVDAGETCVRTICNPKYYIPQFGNVELATILEQEFAKKTGFEAEGVRACEDEDWIKQSKVPFAVTQILLPIDGQSIEEAYTLNQSMQEAVQTIVKEVTQTYFVSNEIE